VQDAFELGQTVMLAGLTNSPEFNGSSGVVLRSLPADGVYIVQVAQPGQTTRLIKVRGGNLLPPGSDRPQYEAPPLELALAIDQAAEGKLDVKSMLTPRSNGSYDSISPRGGILKRLHFTEGSSAGKALKAYCKQVAKRPKCFLCAYIFFTLVPVIIAAIFRGFELETNFDAFIRADGPAMRQREAYILALGEKKALNGRRLQEVPSRHVLTGLEGDVEVEADAVDSRRRLFQVDGEWVEETEEDLEGEELVEALRRLGEEPGNLTSAPGRRLKVMFIRKEFVILHATKSGTALQEKVLREAKDFEAGMQALPIFRDTCENKITSANKKFLCNPGISLQAFAWPSHQSSDDSRVLFKLSWDANGRDMLSPVAFLAYMKSSYDQGDQSRASGWYFPKSFSYPESGEEPKEPPSAIRTTYSFHLKVGESGLAYSNVKANIQKAKDDWNVFISKELYPYLRQEVAKLSNDGSSLSNVYYSDGGLDGFEINSTLVNDLLMAIGSIVFVTLYLRVHTGSAMLSIGSFCIIFFSVPVAYVITPTAKTTIASFLSIFLITGIGCDVVFVFTDFWDQAKGSRIEARLMWMIVHAGESCLATSITTALSFFANLASALQPLREFGMFMGMCVMSAFLLVLFIFPPLLVIHEKRKQKGLRSRIVDISSGDRSSLAVEAEAGKKSFCCMGKGKKEDSVMQSILFSLVSSIASCPVIILLLTLLFFFVAVGGIIMNVKLSTGVPEIFPAGHNQVAGKKILAEFRTEPDLKVGPPSGGNVCRADTVEGLAAESCVLHWCEAKDELLLDPLDTTATTTTSPTRSEVFCWRSPTYLVQGQEKRSIGFEVQNCESLSVASRIAASEAPSSSAWARTLLQAMDDDLSADRYFPEIGDGSSLTLNELKPLVIENWGTGEVSVSRFFHSATAVAHGPFAGSQAIEEEAGKFAEPSCLRNCSCAEDTQMCPDGTEVKRDVANQCKFATCPKITCEMHVLCSEAGRPKINVNGWRRLGEEKYGMERRLQVASFARQLPDDETAFALAPSGGSWAERRLQDPGKLQQQRISNAIDVVVIWGIRAPRWTPLVGAPSEFWSFDPAFEPSNPWAQRAMRDMCTNLPEDLMVWKAKCWIHRFATHLESKGLKFPSRNFEEDVISWYNADTIQAQSHLWMVDRKMVACKLQFFVNVGSTVPSGQGLEYMRKWDQYVDGKNARATSTGNMAWHSASVWVRSEAEKAIIGSTIDTIIIATLSGCLGVYFFTFDIMLAVVVTLIVLAVIVGLAFFIVAVMGWAIGPIEVISLVVFVGYSVTYALHIAHNYNQVLATDADLLRFEEKAIRKKQQRKLAKEARRRRIQREKEGLEDDDGLAEDMSSVTLSVEAAADGSLSVMPADLDGRRLRIARMRAAVLHVGGATLSSALSTAGSSAFLLFCTLNIFVKLGAVVVAVTALSIAGAIVTLPAALILVGPGPDPCYKRKARECFEFLHAMVQGKHSEQDKPLLEADVHGNDMDHLKLIS